MRSAQGLVPHQPCSLRRRGARLPLRVEASEAYRKGPPTGGVPAPLSVVYRSAPFLVEEARIARGSRCAPASPCPAHS